MLTDVFTYTVRHAVKVLARALRVLAPTRSCSKLWRPQAASHGNQPHYSRAVPSSSETDVETLSKQRYNLLVLSPTQLYFADV